jgi:hypothetical protein
MAAASMSEGLWIFMGIYLDIHTAKRHRQSRPIGIQRAADRDSSLSVGGAGVKYADKQARRGWWSRAVQPTQKHAHRS